MLDFVAIVAAFSTVFLITLGLLWQREEPLVERVQSLARYRARSSDHTDSDRPFSERVIRPTLTGFARVISSVLPTRVMDSVKHKLTMSGSTTTLNAFLIQWMVFTVTPPACLLILFLLSGTTIGIAQVWLLMIFSAIGAMLPHMLLSMRIRRRQKTIWKSLPDSLDIMTASVEAGLGLDAAMRRVAEKVPGPFADELLIAMHEVSMGKPRRNALMDLSVRTGVDDITNFVNTVLQAEQMGVTIGQVLRVQADQLRTKRKQRAEQAAHRAGVLMLFPLILCNLPALFIIAVGPAVLLIFQTMSDR